MAAAAAPEADGARALSPLRAALFLALPVAAVASILGVLVLGQPLPWAAAEAAVDDPDGAILAMALLTIFLLAAAVAGKAALRWGPLAQGRRGRGRPGDGQAGPGTAAREDEADWST